MGALVVLMALLWLAGGRITSPSERAARAQAPEASPVSASVELRVLQQVVAARGSVAAATRVEVVPSLADADLDPVVTATPASAGASVAEGDVVIEVSGRPIFVFSGALPAYRDLRPGASGPDIAQLQAALARVGFDPNESDGLFGRGTAQALGDFYSSKGYEIALTSLEAPQILEEARRQVRAAERMVAQAEVELRSDARGSELASLSANVAAAERSLVTARVAANESWSAATARVEVAKAEHNRVSNDQTAVEPDIIAARGAVIEAEGARRLSQSEQGAAVASAEDGVVVARARSQEGQAQGSSGQDLALASAQEDLASARASLSELERRTGTMLPRAELVFMPDLPATVGVLHARVGATVDGPALSLESGELRITAVVPEADWQSISVGDEAVVESDMGDETLAATVEEVGDQLIEDPVAGTGHVVRLRSDEPLDGTWRGRSVGIRMTTEATEAAELVVPLSAVSAGSDGTARVTKLDEKTSQLIVVRAGLSAGGFVAIEAIEGQLQEGDRVLVG